MKRLWVETMPLNGLFFLPENQAADLFLFVRGIHLSR